MSYSLTLAERMRHARNKRDRYARDPEYRLRRINEARVRRGYKPAASLAEVGEPPKGRFGAPRDNQGRFVSRRATKRVDMAELHAGLPGDHGPIGCRP